MCKVVKRIANIQKYINFANSRFMELQFISQYIYNYKYELPRFFDQFA